MLDKHLLFHTPFYITCIRKREEERKEKVCLCGIHVAICQIFVC